MIKLRMHSWLIVFGVLCAAGWIIPTGAPAADVEIRFAGDLPIENHLTEGQKYFAERVKALSQGRVDVKVYPAGQLFSAKDYPKAVPAGAVDMAQVALTQWSGLVPSITFLDLPFFFDGWEHMWRVLDSEAGAILKDNIEKVGVKHLYWMQDGSLAYATKFEVKTLEDMKGRKMRAFSELTAHTLKALGASPTFMGGGEVYMALQRGTVDGAISSLTSFSDRKYFEVTDYITEPRLSFAIYGVLINMDKWDSLDKEVQNILIQAGNETQAWGRKKVQEVEMEAMDVLKNEGMGIYFLPPEEKERWKEACTSVHELVMEKAGDAGPKLFEAAQN